MGRLWLWSWLALFKLIVGMMGRMGMMIPIILIPPIGGAVVHGFCGICSLEHLSLRTSRILSHLRVREAMGQQLVRGRGQVRMALT